MRRRTANEMALYFEPDATATCVVSFCETLPLIAAGTTPAPGVPPSLSLLHSRSESLFTAADTFYSPSAFAAVCWSPDSPNTCGEDLIAGGLHNGGVAVWEVDDRHRMEMGTEKEMPPFVTIDVDDDYLSMLTIQKKLALPLLVHRTLEDAEWEDVGDVAGSWDLQVMTPGKQGWIPNCMEQKHSNRVGIVSPSTTTGMMGYFHDNRYTDPIRGVSFCPTEPHLLASGGGERLVLRDLNQISRSNSVNCWTKVMPSTDISGLAWSCKDKNVLGLTLHKGWAGLVDLRSKSPTVSVVAQSTTRSFSSVDFSPYHDHQLAISCDDLSSEPAVKIWDIRKLTKPEPLRDLCKNSGGVRCLAWNRNKNLILVGTNTKIEVWDDKDLVSRQPTDPCISLSWSHSKRETDCFVASSEKKLTLYELDD